MKRAASIYVEIAIRTTVDELWRLTQTPQVHSRWDLRFSRIDYLPRPDPSSPQRFLYETRIGLGRTIAGEGESVGSRDEDSGGRTSALKFWSGESISLIREGSGYWRYSPNGEGVRFETRYDYRTRFGRFGAVLDRVLFRPMLGWATAWSFDRLRLWIEEGQSPESSLERWVVHGVTRLTLAAVWIYQGLVPKLLHPDTGELAILARLGLTGHSALAAVRLAGALEVLLGLAFLFLWRQRWLFPFNAAVLGVLLAGAFRSDPSLLAAPFNPVTLTLALWALSGIGFWTGRSLPSAANCRRRPAGGS